MRNSFPNMVSNWHNRARALGQKAWDETKDLMEMGEGGRENRRKEGGRDGRREVGVW